MHADFYSSFFKFLDTFFSKWIPGFSDQKTRPHKRTTKHNRPPRRRVPRIPCSLRASDSKKISRHFSAPLRTSPARGTYITFSHPSRRLLTSTFYLGLVDRSTLPQQHSINTAVRLSEEFPAEGGKHKTCHSSCDAAPTMLLLLWRHFTLFLKINNFSATLYTASHALRGVILCFLMQPTHCRKTSLHVGKLRQNKKQPKQSQGHSLIRGI